jgi:predicted Zn-dependent protease
MMFASLEGRHDEALALGERILATFPGYPTILTNLGRAYIAADQPARGVNLLLLAVEQGPIRTEDWALLLGTLGVTGPQPEAAVARLRDKVAANPQRMGLRYTLVVALVRTGHYQAARALLDETPQLAAHPDLEIFVDHAAPERQPRSGP